MPPLIHIIDDDAGLRDALSGLFRSMDYEISEHNSIGSFLAADTPDRPGCVLVDVRLPDGNGLDLQSKLASLGILQPVVVMTGYGDIPMSVRAMKNGAVDFLTKPIRDQDLFDAVNNATALDRERRKGRAETAELRARYESLSPRERQVLALVAAGRLNKQAAGDLSLSEATVKVHRQSAMRKLQVRSVPALIRLLDRLSDIEAPQRLT